MANGVKFGRKPKLSEYQRAEAIKRIDAGGTLASIAKTCAVDISMRDGEGAYVDLLRINGKFSRSCRRWLGRDDSAGSGGP